MGAEQLKAIFQQGTLASELALGGIQTVLERHSVPLTGFTVDDEPVRFPSLLTQLKRLERKMFDLAGQGFEFALGSVGNYRLDFLEIRSQDEPTISWREWAVEYLGYPGFVMAWVVDRGYDHWQNAEDPLQYTAVGRSCAELPMKWNGLPHPLSKRIIDISANPGRWCLRDGYVEAVGALMWLGPSFWALTGADQLRVKDAPWLRVSQPAPSVIEIRAAEQCFTSDGGESGELQSRLRSLLFPAQEESRADIRQ